MFKYLAFFSFITCSLHPVYAQSGKHRYKDLVFPNVSVTKDQSYAPDLISHKDKAYLYDLYQPGGDRILKRPLIIWMHGGGYKFGSKNEKDIEIWSSTFAQRGYVCAAVNYKLDKGNLLFKFDGIKKDCYEGVEYAKQAIAYFKANARRLRIDTSQIILAGNSAGGMTALQAAYCNPADLAKLGQINDPALQIQGRAKVAAVINFWGALFDINWLSNARVPIVSVHGGKDGAVPLTQKTSDKGGIWGSLAIHEQADALNIPNDLKIYPAYAHQLQKHFNPFFSDKETKERWREAGQFAADFLYARVITGKDDQ